MNNYASIRKMRLQALLTCLAIATITLEARAQIERENYLQKPPIAQVNVQEITSKEPDRYSNPNAVMMYRPEQEDALSLYTRTQDGEWSIPIHVNRDDPWIRLLVLSSPKPALIDIAVELDGKPFRLVREQWIDQLQAEAKSVFLVRTGAEIAEELVETPEEKASEEDSKIVDSSEESAPKEADKKAESEEEVPMTQAQRREVQTASRQLINYLAANQSTVDREEVRWLLAERAGGPTLLTLGSATSWKRANEAPLWQALDLDADQTLSSKEISQATKTLNQADINQDENVDLTELKRLSEKHKSKQNRNSHPLVVVIDEHTDWKALKKHLRKAYPATLETSSDLPLLERIRRGDKSLQTSDLVNLCAVASQLVCRVTFGGKSAGITLLSTGESSNQDWQFTSAADQVITLEQQSTYLELTAAQSENTSDSTQAVQHTQVAIGAVVDGYPLFRLLDSDNNKKLTLRERRSVGEFLNNLDLNSDGKIDAREIPTAIRLAVTRGPQVHQHLAKATAAKRKPARSSKSATPPWFAGMDTNNDGDISRREFPGNSTQFAKFDRDGDGLISEKEAQETKLSNE